MTYLSTKRAPARHLVDDFLTVSNTHREDNNIYNNRGQILLYVGIMP
jgi:hypothetical protein